MNGSLIQFILAISLILGCSKDNPKENPTVAVEVGLSQQYFTHNGVQRTYLLYIPESYTVDTKLPLMMNFHGFGGNAADHMASADMRPLAESESFVLIYPQGTLLGGSPHWNPDAVGDGNKSNADDLGFVEALIENLEEEINIDLSRVYACGYSNGSFFSYGLACHLSDKIAAIGSVAGTMMDGTYDGCEASTPTGMINIHGTGDSVVPYNGTTGLKAIDDVLDYWSNLNQATELEISENSGFHQYEYKDTDGDVYVRHFKIINGGHDWNDKIKYGGKSSSQLIWEFVSRFDISGLIE